MPFLLERTKYAPAQILGRTSTSTSKSEGLGAESFSKVRLIDET
jgi:hypothetical protein